MSKYLGDFAEDDTVTLLFNTVDSNGAAIAPAVDGTISVYKENDVTQSVAGVTYTSSFDGVTGVNLVLVDTSADAFYAANFDYEIVLTGATIDGETVNAVLGQFSIGNRSDVTVDDILSGDIDSTGSPLTLKKAIEAIIAIVGGKASYNTTTGVWTVKGRDGATTIYVGTVTNEGTRTTSTIS